jgi:hypothetical protein
MNRHNRRRFKSESFKAFHVHVNEDRAPYRHGFKGGNSIKSVRELICHDIANTKITAKLCLVLLRNPLNSILNPQIFDKLLACADVCPFRDSKEPRIPPSPTDEPGIRVQKSVVGFMVGSRTLNRAGPLLTRGLKDHEFAFGNPEACPDANALFATAGLESININGHGIGEKFGTGEPKSSTRLLLGRHRVADRAAATLGATEHCGV